MSPLLLKSLPKLQPIIVYLNSSYFNYILFYFILIPFLVNEETHDVIICLMTSA